MFYTSKTFSENFSFSQKYDPSIEEQICSEIMKRSEIGFKKYGTSMTRTDLSVKEWLQHAKEEAMDLSIYLQRIINEIDAQSKP